MDPVAIVLCTLIGSAAVVTVAWLLRAPRLDQAYLEDRIEGARAKLELEFAKAIEALEVIAESVKRHRARIDGAARGNPARPEEPQAQRSLWDLSPAEAARLPIEQQLAWADARRQQRRIQ